MNWATNGRGTIPGHGLQILEAQERVYDFLSARCRDLHDMSEEDLLGAPVQPEPPRLSRRPVYVYGRQAQIQGVLDSVL